LNNDFYTEYELSKLNIKSFGKNVNISRKCSIYGDSSIVIGDNVRIDDFCILSGDITIGNYVHISAYCGLYASEGIVMGNFCGLSPRCTVFSKSDDFSGNHMIGPMIPDDLTNPTTGTVVLEDYSQLGANTIVMPKIVCGEGSATGAFTFVNKDLEKWTINCGIPVKKIKSRNKKILTYVGGNLTC
jgi:galactoside O-acetyltransferase